MADRRSVLITGGTGVLGTAVTRRFVADGHRVAVSWIDSDERDRLHADLGDRAETVLLVEADVTDSASVGELVTAVSERNGPVDVLVHLVGGWAGGENVHEHTTETWDRMHAMNLTSAFLCSRAVLGPMRERGWGRIVFVSARTAKRERKGQAAYAISKAGVAVLAETIAEENVGLSVTANCIAPSALDTPANRKSMPKADPARWVPPEDAAAAIAFLASEEAGQLRGAWLPVFGSA
ncbi:MAG: SDR family oxidoreductase [Mycobacteriales bacterium]|nr:SDR family oxidoreductase [Frankia sp.]